MKGMLKDRRNRRHRPNADPGEPRNVSEDRVIGSPGDLDNQLGSLFSEPANPLQPEE